MEQLQTVFTELNSNIRNHCGILESYKFDESLLRSYREKADEESLDLILRSLSTYNSIISEFPDHSEDPVDISKFQFENFLSRFNLKLEDGFANGLDEDHIIEVYAKNNQQIYRSANFFKFSSYDIETLTFIPWDQLYKRSVEDQQYIENLVKTVVSKEIDMMIPSKQNHSIEEIQTQKLFRHSFNKAGCVRDLETNQAMGFASLIKIKEIPRGFGLVQ